MQSAPGLGHFAFYEFSYSKPGKKADLYFHFPENGKIYLWEFLSLAMDVNDKKNPGFETAGPNQKAIYIFYLASSFYVY